MKKWERFITTLIACFAGLAYLTSPVWGGDVTYKKKTFPAPKGQLEIHIWECSTTDGTVDTDTTQRKWSDDEIAGTIIGAWVDNLAAENPDSSYQLWLRDNVMGSTSTGWDWLFGKFNGTNAIDGTDRTSTNNYRQPLDTDSNFNPTVPGLRLVPYATGMGSGTRSFRLYLMVKVYK